MNRTLRRISVLFAVAALLPITVEGQGAQGTVTGRVTDAATNQPLADAQVRVVGTTRGALSGADGRFTITGVVPGNQTVRAQRIGYSMADQLVNVTSGAPATVNFSLRAAATTLDQVVISATGQTQRRRESGATSATIDSNLVSLAAAPTFSNVLTARAAGVAVQSSSGTTGTSSRIRIRGANSITLSNDPLLIVDGVRLNNSSNSSSYGVGGMTISRFDDINPEDIDNIEIIKGPAASSLYGTAAANGVIQITTKRGRAGRTRWNAYTGYGTIKDYIEYPSNYAQIGRNPAGTRLVGASCSIDAQARGLCIPNADSLMSWNPIENVSPFRTGFSQTHGLNTSGGSEAATYFISGEFEREQGIYAPSFNRKYNGRTNLRAQLRPNLDASINVGYVRARTSLPQNDNNAFGAIASGLIGKAFDCSIDNFRNAAHFSRPSCGTDSSSRGYFTANVPSTDYFAIQVQQDVDRFIGGLVTNWQPAEWLRGNMQLGADLLNRYDQILTPPNRVAFSATTLEGSRGQTRLQIPTYNWSTSFTGTRRIGASIESNTSIGAQYTREEFHSTSAFGAILLPGTASLNGTSARFSVNEVNQVIVTIGAYAQQQFAFRDRLFLTAAIRGDDGSTFGSNFSLIKYPAVSLSWVASEESFFPRLDWLSQLRLRGAYGQSGQRPGFRDPETFFNPVSVRVNNVEVSGVTVGGTGNAELKPERSAEFEGGFDASFLDGRLGLELTGYTRTTEDALVSRPLAPSLGASASRFDNLGTVRNKGIEALVTATLLDVENVRLETTVTASSNRNQVVDLGEGITPIFFGFSASQVHRNGYPLGSYFARKVLSFEDKNGDGYISRINCPVYGGVANVAQIVGGPVCEVVLSDSAEYLGGPLPTREMNFNSAITLFRDFRISGLLNYRGGYSQFNTTREFRCGQFLNCRDIMDRTAPLADQAKVIARLMGTVAPYVEDASFWKLRELSLTYTIPRNLVSTARLEGASITLAGRNLATWTKYTGFDPEVNSTATGNFTTSDFLAQPPVRHYTARFNFNF